MAEAADKSVLHRKISASRRPVSASGTALSARVLGTALARAAENTMSMAVQARSASERIAPLSDLLELLPERGLLAVLDGPGESQGLAAFDTDLLSAVIEKQMTGALSSAPRPPRRVTRTDAILAADLIDAVLAEFEDELIGREETRWASGFGYSSYLDDPRPLGLLLEDVEYRIFTIDADLESGGRQGRLVLALPAEGRGPLVREPAQQAFDPDIATREHDWRKAMEASVTDGEVRLSAVIHRLRIPIAAISGLRPGDELTIPAMTIDKVRLTASNGQGFGQWRLGQCQGYRALRLGEPIQTRNSAASEKAMEHGDEVAEPSEDAVALPEISGDVGPGSPMEIEGHAETIPDLAEDPMGDIPDWPDDLALPEDLSGMGEPGSPPEKGH